MAKSDLRGATLDHDNDRCVHQQGEVHMTATEMRRYLAGCILAACVPAAAQEISKPAWIEHMKTALPVAASATRVCLNKFAHQFPENFRQPDDGSHWGGIVGECAGNAYESALRDNLLKSQECAPEAGTSAL